jgi:hypothetical protein
VLSFLLAASRRRAANQYSNIIPLPQRPEATARASDSSYQGSIGTESSRRKANG